MRAAFVFVVLFSVRMLSWLFFRVRHEWVPGTPDDEDPWRDMRVGILLNHTSLFEPVFTAAIPNRILWRMATVGALPIADVTLKRPLAGLFFRSIAAQVITVSRKRDSTWSEMLAAIQPDSVIVMMPEGRMMRRDGLDKDGRPMTVRGGVADIIKTIPCGRMVIGYSGGLHSIQAPGEKLPSLFQTVRLRYESVDIAEYREEMLALAGERGFKRAVVRDLERRRDENCPFDEDSTRPQQRPEKSTSAA